MANPLYELIKKIEALPEPLDKAFVKNMILQELEGRRISLSYKPQRYSRQELSDRLIARLFTKADAVKILTRTFQISKTYAYMMVNISIDKRCRGELDDLIKALSASNCKVEA